MDTFYSLSLFKRLLIGFFAAIICAYAGNVILTYFFAWIHNLSFNQYEQSLLKATQFLTDKRFVREALLLQTIVVFIIPAVVLLYAFAARPFSIIGQLRKKNLPLFVFFLLLMLGFIPGINLLSSVNGSIVSSLVSSDSLFTQLYEQNEKIYTFLMDGEGVSELLAQIVLMALIPAFAEELFFRGMLQTYCEELFVNPYRAILFVAIVFSVLHLDVYNFIPRVAMGVLYGLIFYWTHSIWIPIIAHFMHNAVVVTVNFTASHNSFNIEDFGSYKLMGDGTIAIFSLVCGLLSILAVLYGMWVLYTKYR
ncbi:MAG: CPBP family intramembrane metalloprotease [Bacteroidales bacterium]|jgi:membrane protease YdiL (CAAX protease family)|nr:CPBP family intramembrane metalloprotease [Bacteroidales bacterium]